MLPLFPWWIKYPNVNNEIQNLDWLIYTVKHLTEEVKNFINLNTIKYADPILWDITSQYEANTIVVDPQTGDAFISTRPVPYGVSLSNTDYWTKIYNYASAISKLEEQIAAANEGLSTTASAPRSVGELVWLNGLLYKITADMIAGDSYVVNSNCVKTTIEEELNLWISNINSKIGELSDLNTTDKDSIVDAINELALGVNSLNKKTYLNVSEMVADNNLAIGDYAHTLGYHNAGIGAATYQISDTAGVAAITLDSGLYANIVVTDEIYLSQLGLEPLGDISALVPAAASLINNRGIIHIDMQCSATETISLSIDGEYELSIDGHEHKITYTGTGYLFSATFSNYGYNLNYRNLRIVGNDSNNGIIYYNHGSALNRSEIRNCIINNCNLSITLDNSRQLYIDNVSFYHVNRGISFYAHDNGFCGDSEITNCQFEHLNNSGQSINFSTSEVTSGFGGITIQNNDFYMASESIRFQTNGTLGDCWILNNQFDGISAGSCIKIYSENAATLIVNLVVNDNYATAPQNFLTIYVPNGRVRSAAIHNNYINGNSNTHYTMDINCGANGDIELSDNRFTQCSHTTDCVVRITKALIAKFVSNLFSLVDGYTNQYLNIGASVDFAIVTNNISNGNVTGTAYAVSATTNIKDNNLPT